MLRPKSGEHVTLGILHPQALHGKGKKHCREAQASGMPITSKVSVTSKPKDNVDGDAENRETRPAALVMRSHAYMQWVARERTNDMQGIHRFPVTTGM